MNKEQKLRQLLDSVPPSWGSRVVKKHPEFLTYLNALYPNYELKTQIYLFRNNYDNEPRCLVCEGILNKITAETCSKLCRENLKKNRGLDSISKMQNSLIDKWGVDNAALLPHVQEKRKTSLIEKYGVPYSPKATQHLKTYKAEYYKKHKESLQEKYGVDNPAQIKGHGEKVRHTMQNNYGVNHWTQIPKYKKRFGDKLYQFYGNLASNIQIIEINEASSSHKDAFETPNRRITFKCECCGTQNTLASETYKWRQTKAGTPCANCAELTPNVSLQEKEVVNFIESLNAGYLEKNIRTVIPPMELDIWLPEYNIAIEYCGLYWHREDKVGEKYHSRKLQYCHEKNIRLITIFEDEWLYKTEIVKNRLTHLLHQTTEIVGARKCSVKEITTAEAKLFCVNNHIQGYAPANTKLGLFYGEELIGVMTFSKLSRAKGSRPKDNEFELSRMCFSPEYSVPGGANKLWKYFLTNKNPKKVISYSDLRWNTGKVYEKLGMVYVGDTPINYWYINGNKRIHRYKLRKQPHEPKDRTERELRSEQGWNRIWDCGNAKYEWTNHS